MLKERLENVRAQSPLVHNITNYVTVNDCANALLALGASPIMADDIAEVEEMISICSALVINIGTLNERTLKSMIAAGKMANALGKPVILDPVGAGASRLRTEAVFELLKQVQFSVIRGNISEIKTVYAGSGTTKGVDADVKDALSTENQASVIAYAKALAEKTGAIIAITGAVDLIATREEACLIFNGHEHMSKITGTGCMLTSLLGAFLGANPEQAFLGTVAAVSFMGLCGEVAHEKTHALKGGPSTMRMFLIDAMSQISPDQLEEGARYERQK